MSEYMKKCLEREATIQCERALWAETKKDFNYYLEKAEKILEALESA